MRCEVPGCPHEAEANLARCRGHEGGFSFEVAVVLAVEPRRFGDQPHPAPPDTVAVPTELLLRLRQHVINHPLQLGSGATDQQVADFVNMLSETTRLCWPALLARKEKDRG